MEHTLRRHLESVIRSIPDYPHEGIIFRDITTLLGDAPAFRRSVDELVHPYSGAGVKFVAGIEARGFILGGAMAHQLSCGFVPIRKSGKLPYETASMTYELEYGEDQIEIHKDAVAKGDRVLLVDDLIATGGTAEAAIKLLKQFKTEIVAACFIVDLPELGGRQRIQDMGIPVRTLVEFDGK
ncbi:MAG: adenine phosphoribosyltransferase [Rhizobiaceae bacterium]